MSSDLSEFLGLQFVQGLLGLTCFVGVLLVLTIAGLVYLRRRKAQQQINQAAPFAYASAPTLTGNMDMPDLNMLTHTPASPVPTPKPTLSAPTRTPRKGTFTITPKDAAPTEAVEVLTLLRDVMDGTLIVQMGDKTYQNVNSDPEFKDKLNRLMRELGQTITKAAAAAPLNTPQPSDLIETQAQIPPAASEIAAAEPAFLAPKKPVTPPPPAYDGKMPGDLPSFKLADNPMQKLKRGQKADLPPVPEINIAGAIEAYLQHKLSHTPEYAGRSIHIYPAPGGGVSIEVDGQYFEAVSDISDPAVKEFLSSTITEWQERH